LPRRPSKHKASDAVSGHAGLAQSPPSNKSDLRKFGMREGACDAAPVNAPIGFRAPCRLTVKLHIATWERQAKTWTLHERSRLLGLIAATDRRVSRSGAAASRHTRKFQSAARSAELSAQANRTNGRFRDQDFTGGTTSTGAKRQLKPPRFRERPYSLSVYLDSCYPTHSPFP